MDVAELVLDYLRVLVWPGVAIATLVVFRLQLAGKISDLKEARTPFGEVGFFERKVRSVGAMAEQAASDQEQILREASATPPTSGDATGVEGRGDKDVTGVEPTDEPPGMEIPKDEYEELIWLSDRVQAGSVLDAFEIHDTSPSAAVLLAYRELEVTADAWIAFSERFMEAIGLEPPSTRDPRPKAPLADRLERHYWTKVFTDPIRELATLRNRVAHSRHAVSPDSAFEYIVACEDLIGSLQSHARSTVEHAIRSA